MRANVKKRANVFRSVVKRGEVNREKHNFSVNPLAFLAVVGGTMSAFGASIVAIPPVGSFAVTPVAINSAGQVAGTISGRMGSGSNQTHAVIYSPGAFGQAGTTIDLGAPGVADSGYYLSYPSVVTDAGAVVGRVSAASTGYSYVGFSTATGSLATYGATRFADIGASRGGVIVGGTFTTSATFPTPVYTSSGSTAFTSIPVPAGTTGATLLAVNSSGSAAGLITSGTSGLVIGSTSQINLATFSVDGGLSIVDAGAPAGFKLTNAGAYGRPLGINESGVIFANGVGVSDGSVSQALKYVNGGFVTLAGLTGQTGARATGINTAGTIVGYDGTTALAWLDGSTTPIDLNTMLPVGSGWVLRYATAINDAGTITGMGTFNGVQQAFVLAVPEPGVAVVGLPVAIGLLRRRR
jgi:hypothetical protein